MGGLVLLTKMPRGWLSMPEVKFMVMTMELPSNQYDTFPSGRLDTAIVLSSCPISICRAAPACVWQAYRPLYTGRAALRQPSDGHIASPLIDGGHTAHNHGDAITVQLRR